MQQLLMEHGTPLILVSGSGADLWVHWGPSEGRALAFAFCGALQLQMRVLIAKLTSGQNVYHNIH